MAPKLPLPRGWKRRVRSSVLHILALSHYTFTALLAKAAKSRNRQVRLPGRQPATLLRSALKVLESVGISDDSISAHYGTSEVSSAMEETASALSVSGRSLVLEIPASGFQVEERAN